MAGTIRDEVSDDTSPLLNKSQTQTVAFETESACDTMDDDNDESEAKRWREEVRQSHQHCGFLQRPSVSLLCFLLAIVCIGDMVTVTPSISLTMKKVCDGDSAENGSCDPIKVQETVSSIVSGSMILGGLFGLSVTGAWGQLSDRVGRVKVFACATFIRFIGNGLHFFTLSSWCPYSPTAIIVASSLSNLSGGAFSLLANSYSYVADITEPEERTQAMGSVMSVTYATMGVGPMISSLLVELPFGSDALSILTSLMCLLLATFLCLTALQEPRHEQARRNSCHSLSSGKSSPLDPLKQLWLPRTRTGSIEPRCTVILLLVLDVLFLCVAAGSGPAFLLFFSYRYEWRSRQLGYYLSFTNMGKAAVLLILAPHALKLLRNRYGTLTRTADHVDVLFVRISLSSLLLGLSLIFWRSHDTGMVYLYAFSQAPGALCSPTIQSAIIKYCPKSATGQCFGGIALIRSAVMLVFPAALLRFYGYSVSTSPQLFMLIPLSCAFLAVMFSFVLREPKSASHAEDTQGQLELRRRSSWLSLAPSEQAREEAMVQTESLRENYSQA